MVAKKVLPFDPPAGTIIYDPDEREQPDGRDEPQANGKHQLKPLPSQHFERFDISTLPMRAWLHAGHYIRKHVVMTIGPGGYGKTSLVLLNAIEMALQLGLIGKPPEQRLRVWYWNGEDPHEEIMRRIAAVCLHYEIDMGGLEKWLVVGDKIDADQRLAFLDQRQQLRMRDVVLLQIEQFIAEHGIDVLILDPFVAFHSLPEANNSTMEELVSRLAGIADRRKACIELSHHTRKLSANFEVTVDDSRGAGAIANAARSVRVLNRMTNKEAEMPAIAEEERRQYLRVGRDKHNMVPATKATWIHLVNVPLPNGPNGGVGDNVQAVEQWDYPQPFKDVSADDMRWLRDEVRRSDVVFLTGAQAGERWIGARLAQKLKLDVTNEAHRKRINVILKTWFANGVLAVEERLNEHRKKQKVVVLGDWNETVDDAPLPF